MDFRLRGNDEGKKLEVPFLKFIFDLCYGL